MMVFNEKDWKLFRKKVPEWQERYMEKLTEQYIALLSSSEHASERFWQLEERIREDKKSPGVAIHMSRSTMLENLIRLFADKVISLDDLTGFSDDLIECMKFIIEL